MARPRSLPSEVLSLSAWVLATVLVPLVSAWSQVGNADWQQLVRARIDAHQLDAALALVDERLSHVPADLEAHGWRGRLLAWQGHWREAESEYRHVLDGAPNDTDILCGLADVLLWQEKLDDALAVADRALHLVPSDTSILLRRARILQALGRTEDSRRLYQEILALDPDNREAINGSRRPVGEFKHEFRVGGDGSTFNYTAPAGAQSLLLSSRWTPRWSSALGTSFYQRFGDHAAKFSASGSFRLTRHDWLNFGGALGHTQGTIPKREGILEYGHGFHLADPWVKGLEASYQQHWFWYDGAHILVLSLAQLYYLPLEWTWSITVTGARSGFTGTGMEWVPSGSTRLEFPLHRRVRANLSFGNGTENFALVDQIGRFSARTYAGGLKYRCGAKQDISGYVAVQDRTGGRTQNSFGVSYGFRF